MNSKSAQTGRRRRKRLRPVLFCVVYAEGCPHSLFVGGDRDALYKRKARDRLERPGHHRQRGPELQNVRPGLGRRGLVLAADNARVSLSEPGGLQASGDAEGHATESSCDTVYAPQPPERICHSHEREPQHRRGPCQRRRRLAGYPARSHLAPQ